VHRNARPYRHALKETRMTKHNKEEKLGPIAHHLLSMSTRWEREADHLRRRGEEKAADELTRAATELETFANS
jgi:hypothetical protein